MGDQDVELAFKHWQRLETKEQPLSPIRPELESHAAFTETDKTCSDDACQGVIWEGNGEKICGQCSAVYGDEHTTFRPDGTAWTRYWDYRPHYHKSGNARLVGSFDHDWIESSDTDEPVSEIDPEAFYQS